MANKNNISLLEPISHVTGPLPFSFHHTIIEKEEELVLYQHWHKDIEFLYIERGETIFCIEGMEYHLKAGEAIFVPPNLLHMARRKDRGVCEFYAFVFSPSFLPDAHPHFSIYIQPILFHSLPCCLHLTPESSWQNRILNDLREMFSLSVESIEQWELQIYGVLLMIWQSLYNNHLSKINSLKNHSKLIAQLEPSIDFIHQSYDTEITLKDLSLKSNLSEGQFCRLFKQLTGFTPFCYLNRYRILESCYYLRNTTKKITEIASLCGFNNISYFNREFIRIMKMTPSAYRKIIQA